MNSISTYMRIPVRSVPFLRPFHWLLQGWYDLLNHRPASLAYGLLVSALGIITLSYQRHPFFVASAITAFMLLGPIVAAGLCELSRLNERHESADFEASLKTLRPHHKSLLGVANRLIVISACWFIISYLLIQATLETVAPNMRETVWGDVLHHLSSQQIAAYFFSGGVLAIIVLAMSLITVPIIIDRDIDATAAINTSVRACLKGFPSIVLWAILIVALVAVGFATFLLGMIVIFPLLGHATWHAYRDLVTPEAK